jgi:cephalosporin-C deacetylase-like acetyl esterase
VVNPFDYSCDNPSFNVRLEEVTSRWSRYKVDFYTAHPTRYQESNTVRGEYFHPKGIDQAPLAVLLHGLGDQSVIPCRLLAHTLVKRGIACFIMYLVFHSSRMPQTIRKRAPAFTSDEWFRGYQNSVIEIRQVLDWAGERQEINIKEVAVVGISLGGFVSAIAMGVDERIKAGVFIVCGGDSEIITWKSRSDMFRKGSICAEAECHRIHGHYPKYLTEVAERGFENVTPVKSCFLTDTMTFAHRLQGRPVLMINALWDKYIPRQATLGFWEASGKPIIIWLPAGHASIWLWYPLISRRIISFLSSTFGMEGRRSL